MSEDGVFMNTLVCYSHQDGNKGGFEFCINVVSSLDEEHLKVLKGRLKAISDEMYDLRDKTDQVSTDRLRVLGKALSKDFWSIDYIARTSKVRPMFSIDNFPVVFKDDATEMMKGLGG